MKRLLVCACVCLAPSVASAHPDHQSQAEATLNPETGHLEVSLSVDPASLASALTPRSRQWTQRTMADRIEHYLTGCFRIETPIGLRKLRFIGLEPEGARVWLHFEVLDVGRLHGATVTHTCLMEVELRQVNALRLRAGPFSKSVLFDSEGPRHTIDARGG